MHHHNFWGWFSGGVASICVGMLAQVNAFDVTAALGYVSGIGLAFIAIYAKYRDERRKQDMADRESRRHDCEEALWSVQSQLTEAKHRIAALESELARWQALWDGSRSARPSEPPCKS